MIPAIESVKIILIHTMQSSFVAIKLFNFQYCDSDSCPSLLLLKAIEVIYFFLSPKLERAITIWGLGSNTQKYEQNNVNKQTSLNIKQFLR